jgi:hypothetical protein
MRIQTANSVVRPVSHGSNNGTPQRLAGFPHETLDTASPSG